MLRRRAPERTSVDCVSELEALGQGHERFLADAVTIWMWSSLGRSRGSSMIYAQRKPEIIPSFETGS